MASKLFKETMTANGTARPLSGLSIRAPKWPSLVELGLHCTDANVVATVYFGEAVIMEEGPVNKGAVDVFPKFPDERDLEEEIAAGEEIVIVLRETAGGTPSVTGRIKTTPLG